MARATVEVDEQEALFPELDKDKPKEKELIKALKRWREDKREHAEAMNTLKEKMDDSASRAISLMHDLSFEKVKLEGEIFERRPGDEKITVKKAKKPAAEEDGTEE